jgi:hypothetical protein
VHFADGDSAVGGTKLSDPDCRVSIHPEIDSTNGLFDPVATGQPGNQVGIEILQYAFETLQVRPDFFELTANFLKYRR